MKLSPCQSFNFANLNMMILSRIASVALDSLKRAEGQRSFYELRHNHMLV